MNELKIVATILIREQFKNEMVEALKKVTDGTRNEEGNISYDLFQDINDPLKYIILETWKSRDAINEHNQTEHYQTFKKDIADKIESIMVNTIKSVY